VHFKYTLLPSNKCTTKLGLITFNCLVGRVEEDSDVRLLLGEVCVKYDAVQTYSLYISTTDIKSVGPAGLTLNPNELTLNPNGLTLNPRVNPGFRVNLRGSS